MGSLVWRDHGDDSTSQLMLCIREEVLTVRRPSESFWRHHKPPVRPEYR
jgi:hypothetical protein